MSLLRRVYVALMCAAIVVGAVGCAEYPSASAWVVTPVSFDNAMDDEQGSRVIDVAFPMSQLSNDTKGGFWGESSGSWLHVGRSGETLRRFNLDGEMAYLHVRGLAALSSTRLVVSGYVDGDTRGGLHQFDTRSMTWTPIDAEGEFIGDVATVGDAILYVDYSFSAEGAVSFRLRRIEPDGTIVVLGSAQSATDGELVRLDVSPGGHVLVDTGVEREEPSTADGAWIKGGSGDAHRIIDEQSADCRGHSFLIRTAPDVIALPFLCHAQAGAWLDANTLIVSAGSESGAVLARVTLPASESR